VVGGLGEDGPCRGLELIKLGGWSLLLVRDGKPRCWHILSIGDDKSRGWSLLRVVFGESWKLDIRDDVIFKTYIKIFWCFFSEKGST